MTNIIACDDDKDIVKALKIYLSSEGLNVLEAYNGKEALDVFAKNDVKLVRCTNSSYEGLEYIYSMKKPEGESLMFVVDTDEVDPADVLEPYEWLPSMGPAFDGEVCADEDFTSDEWGTYLSGYAPIFDSKEKVVGIVGCDITRETINKRLSKLRILIIFFGVIPNVVIAMMLRRGAKS